MFYRILRAPPGYPSQQHYRVLAYESLEYDSVKFWVTKEDGAKSVATLEEARRLLPAGARYVHSQADHQFIELWEA